MLHKFPDSNLTNYHSTSGQFETSPVPPTMVADAMRNYSVRINHNKNWFRFIPADDLNDVIGVSLKGNLKVPHINRQFFEAHPVTQPQEPEEAPRGGGRLGRIGAGPRPIRGLPPIGFLLGMITLIDLDQFKVDVSFDTVRTGKHLKVSIGENFDTKYAVDLPKSDTLFFDLEIRWLPNGQLKVWIDQKLVLFKNDFALGRIINVSEIVVGRGVPPEFDHLDSVMYDFTLLKVKVLQKDSATVTLAEAIPHPVKAPKIPDECIARFRRNQVMVTYELRNFMAAFSQKYTKNWQSGDSSIAITMIAKDAHLKAKAMGLVFVAFLNDPDQTNANTLLLRLRDFLIVMKTNMPQEYNALIHRLTVNTIKENNLCKEYRQVYFDHLDIRSKLIYSFFQDADKLIREPNPPSL